MNRYFYDTVNRINFSIAFNKKYLFIDNITININIIKIIYSLNFIERYRIYNKKILVIFFNYLKKKFVFYSKISNKKYFSIKKIKKLRFLNGIISTNKGLMLLSRALKLKLGGELLCILND